MSILRFDGEGAGLGIRKGGDANDVCSYTLFCGNGECSLELGPLGAFVPNADGQRSVCCPRCDKVTVVDKDGYMLALADGKDVRKMMRSGSYGKEGA